MALTDVDICNKALTKLGARTIASIAVPTNDTERACAKLYTETKAMWLAAHPWRFTVKRVLLVAAAAPVNRWTYGWSMPGDAIAGTGPLALFNAVGANVAPQKDWEFTAGVVETNTTPVYADYQFNVSEASWPPLFVAFAEAAFAAELGPIVQDRSTAANDYRVEAWGTPGEGGSGGKFGFAKRRLAMYRPPQSFMQDEGPLAEARFR